jgi:cell division protease FtsH
MSLLSRAYAYCLQKMLRCRDYIESLSAQGLLMFVGLILLGIMLLHSTFSYVSSALIKNKYATLETASLFQSYEAFEVKRAETPPPTVILNAPLLKAYTTHCTQYYGTCFLLKTPDNPFTKNTDTLFLVFLPSSKQTFITDDPGPFSLEELTTGPIRVLDPSKLSSSDKEYIANLRTALNPSSVSISDRLLNLLILLGLFGVLLTAQTKMMGRSSVKFTHPSAIEGDMDDLIGMDDIKADVLRVDEFLKERQRFRAYGIDKPQNILFSGPPGTGKTKLAGLLAKRANLPILFMSAANLETGFVNGGAGTLEIILKRAKRQSPCIIFLDEAQDLFLKRGGNQRFHDDTQNTLLAILDGVNTRHQTEIIWILASNFNENNLSMDEAMLRRFAIKVDFRLPNPDERRLIFQHYLNRVDALHKAVDIDLDSLVYMTEGRSPADIQTVVQDASIMAARERRPIQTTDLNLSAERLLIGMNNDETTIAYRQERKQIAVHEVGHFLMQFLNTGGDLHSPMDALSKMNVLKISLKSNARTGALGFVFKKPQQGFLRTCQSIEDMVSVLYAGTVNEALLFGNKGRSNGAANDIQEATKLLYHAVVEARFYDDAKLNFNVLQNTHSHTSTPTLDMADRATIEKVSKTLYDKAHDALLPLTNLSEYLSEQLLERVELSCEEMLSLMQTHLTTIHQDAESTVE